MTDWLTIESLSFGYKGTRVLDRLSIAVPEHQPVLVLLGRSGVGKSTAISLLAGHLRPQSGRIRICGETVNGPSPHRPVVFQDHNLFPWMTVIGNVAFGLKCLGVARSERVSRARALLDLVGLGATAKELPRSLSGGMRQRVGFARALAVEPPCLLMDEPFSALDQQTVDVLIALLLRQLAQTTLKIILVVHDLQHALRLGHRILILRAPGDTVDFPVMHQADRKSADCHLNSGFQMELETLTNRWVVGG